MSSKDMIEKNSQATTCVKDTAYFCGAATSLFFKGFFERNQIRIIGKFAFYHSMDLTEVTFPSCLEEICESAFENCYMLETVSFSEDSKLEKIGDRAFRKCLRLHRFDFPENLESIGNKAFELCQNLRKINLFKTKVRHIGNNAFNGCNAIIYLPPTILASDLNNICENRTIVDKSHQFVQRDGNKYYFSNGTIFNGSRISKYIFIRQSVEKISRFCFAMSNLVKLSLPSSVKEIHESAFENSHQLSLIVFKKDSQLNVIERSAFASCSKLKTIKFPKSLKIIREKAFDKCGILEKVVFPNDSQLERIEAAFTFTNIEHLALPPSVKEIVNVSYQMNNLKSFYINGERFRSNREGNMIFSKDGCELVCVVESIKSLDIPDDVLVIKKRALYGSSIVGRLFIPPSVEVIEEEAFLDCFYLKIIEFSPDSELNSLALNAFGNLEKLILNNGNFETLENGVIMSLEPVGIVFVPRYMSELEIDDGVEAIYSNAFFGTKIKSLRFPKSLKKISYEAFRSSLLESVTFEDGTELDFIDSYAFFATRISKIKLPIIKEGPRKNVLCNNIKTIEFVPNFNPVVVNETSFYYSSHLVDINIPKSSISAIQLVDFICSFLADIKINII